MLSEAEYTRLFRKLGVRGAEDWARVEVQERLGNLVRMGFLTQAWAEIPASVEELARWADATIRTDDAAPAAATMRLRDAGMIDADLLAFVRALMGEFLFRIGYLLDDPSFTDPELQERIQWGFYEETPQGLKRRVGGLHELTWDADPLGGEQTQT